MISEEERIRRQKAIDSARCSVRLEGCILDAEIERMNAEFIAGGMTLREHTTAILAYTASPQRTA